MTQQPTPLLGIYPPNVKVSMHKDICTPMLIAALVTVAKTGRQPRTEDRIKMAWYIHAREYYYSATRREETLPFAIIWTGLDNIMLSEVSQIKNVKNHMISLICGI